MMGFLRDENGQMSTGRICALFCLAEAIFAQWQRLPIETVGMWLAAATGNYTLSKVPKTFGATPPVQP